mmetsp:Transcript_79612/g.228482  ORF Transcript_79612/g.228482 Transcript_79612/m.228482 type:complete len:237 (+) Transcript_79612:1174-1884(+)
MHGRRGVQAIEQSVQISAVLLADGSELPRRRTRGTNCWLLFSKPTNKLLLGRIQKVLNLLGGAALVAVQPALARVLDFPRVVRHKEGSRSRLASASRRRPRNPSRAQPRGKQKLLTAARRLASLVQRRVAKARVSRIPQPPPALLPHVVQDIQDSRNRLHGPGAVLHAHRLVGQALALVEGLLREQAALREELLEPLVGEVDQQLLQRVGRQALKSIDIQQGQLGGGGWRSTPGPR